MIIVLRRIVFAAFCVFWMTTGSAQLADGQFASGSFLIGVQDDAARAMNQNNLFGNGSRAFKGMLWTATPERTDDRRETHADDQKPAHWILTRAPLERVTSMSNGEAWDAAHQMIDEPQRLQQFGFNGYEMERLTTPGALYSIEPSVAIWDPADEKAYDQLDKDLAMSPDWQESSGARNETARSPEFLVAGTVLPPPPPPKVRMVSSFSNAWPPPSKEAPTWHFDANHSNLADARTSARNSFNADGTGNVLVYHLDTGYYNVRDAIRPRFLQPTLSFSFFTGDFSPRAPRPHGFDHFHGGPFANDGHGAATLSILAGNEVTLPSGSTTFIGGAPLVRVACTRISDSVVHFETGAMAAAINAAVQHGADLITMAAGGPPSDALRNAVDGAYESGVPMVFAAGDFYALSPFPAFLSIFSNTPHTTVYPARYGRALAVTGATYEQESYANGVSYGFSTSLGSWAMRGSYGPASVLPHTLAAYTPNVLAQKGDELSFPNRVTAAFGGTSAATPQVAAAGALWLQKYRKEGSLPPKDWHRAEAVYQALFTSARPPRRANLYTYLGRGTLNARAALAKAPKTLYLRKRPQSQHDDADWIYKTGLLIKFFKADGGTPRPIAQVAQLSAKSFPTDSGFIRDSESSVAKIEAHNRMFVVELLQLLHGSNLLQVLMGPDPEAADMETLRQVYCAAIRDPRMSGRLRDLIKRLDLNCY